MTGHRHVSGTQRGKKKDWPCRYGDWRVRQQGQALIMSLFLLVIIAMMTFYQFSTGQITTARMRLENATDAAAYSAAIMRARVFNYYAYSNRAILFNEVAIAQTATLTSYAGFLAQGIHNIKKYGQYIPYIRNVIVQIDAIASAMNRALRVLSAVEVGSRSAYAHALAASQEAMWLTTSGYFLSQVTNEVMRKSDEHFHAYLLRGTTAERLSRRYEGKGRSRLQDMVNRSLDGYSKNRSFDLKLPGLRTWISMRGQTEMIRDHDTSELERWQAYDTMSIHHKRLFRKRRHEMPLAWSGVELARRSEGGMDRLNNRADHNKTDNAKAYQNIHDRSFWSTIAYLGLPTVRDLDEGSTAFRQNHRFPADRITVVGVVKKRNDINTARQIGLGSGRLMLEDSLPDFRQDAVMMAMSAAEIYFRHPPGADERIEYASMYSPYWQVRLAGVQAQERLLAGASASLGRSS